MQISLIIGLTSFTGEHNVGEVIFYNTLQKNTLQLLHTFY
jgi:hypothetical protein